jgi:hypothetical protein
MFIVPRWRGKYFDNKKIPNWVDKKLNRITERTREQFAWRNNKLATTVDDSSTKADNKKKRRLLFRLRRIARKIL